MLQVGHLVRYSAEFGAVAARMARPLYIEATRIAPFKPRGTDVSVILDLMIHDLDLVLALVDSPIAGVDAVGAPIASALEDIANARVRFENGCVATITASRISLKTERKMRLFGREGYMSVNFVDRKLMLIGREHGMPIPGGQGYRMQETGWKDHDALAAEHAAFVASVLDGAPVLVDAEAGRRALAAALAVTREHAGVQGPGGSLRPDRLIQTVESIDSPPSSSAKAEDPRLAFVGRHQLGSPDEKGGRRCAFPPYEDGDVGRQ